jgi:hypothetical protein
MTVLRLNSQATRCFLILLKKIASFIYLILLYLLDCTTAKRFFPHRPSHCHGHGHGHRHGHVDTVMSDTDEEIISKSLFIRILLSCCH